MKNYRIVIPLHNEAVRVEKLISRFTAKQKSSIIFVDDGSTDETYELVKKMYPEITILRHEINLGKGKALETGCEKAIQERTEVIVLMDGDLQHKPEDVRRFLRVFKRNPEVEIVFGARKIGKTMRLMAFLGNKVLTIIVNLLFHYFLNDTQCGFRAFKANVFEKLRWESSGYSAETEMIINAVKNSLIYKEINIDTIYLDYHKGTYFLDGLKILFKILTWKLSK